MCGRSWRSEGFGWCSRLVAGLVAFAFAAGLEGAPCKVGCKAAEEALAPAVVHQAVSEANFNVRGGAPVSCYYLKHPDVSIPYIIYANVEEAWSRNGYIYDYAEGIADAIDSLYGVKSWRGKRDYPADLHWAQYLPGGRSTSTSTIFWDSAIIAKTAEEDPALASIRFETIVRQSILSARTQSRLVVRGDCPAFVAAYREGNVHPAILVAERIADHYGLPTLNLAHVAAVSGREALPEVIRCFAAAVFDPSKVPAEPPQSALPASFNARINASSVVVGHDTGAVLGDDELSCRVDESGKATFYLDVGFPFWESGAQVSLPKDEADNRAKWQEARFFFPQAS